MSRCLRILSVALSLVACFATLILFVAGLPGAIPNFIDDHLPSEGSYSYPEIKWHVQDPPPTGHKFTISTVTRGMVQRQVDTGVLLGIYEPVNAAIIGPDWQSLGGASWYSQVRGRDRVINWGGLQFAHWSWIVTRGDAPGPRIPQFRGRERMITIPYWLIFLLTLILPLRSATRLLKAARMRRLRRMNILLCEKCGYDLRATPSRCPECGEVSRTESNKLSNHE